MLPVMMSPLLRQSVKELIQFSPVFSRQWIIVVTATNSDELLWFIGRREEFLSQRKRNCAIRVGVTLEQGPFVLRNLRNRIQLSSRNEPRQLGVVVRRHVFERREGALQDEPASAAIGRQIDGHCAAE